MKRVGYLTSEDLPELIDDDLLALEPLRKRGIEIAPVVWDKSPADLDQLELLIFRSCWNYHQKHREFEAFLNRLEVESIPTLNSVSLTRWNIDKSYLLELAAKGACLPETRLIKRATQTDLAAIVGEIGSEMVVIKPTVSLNGHDTYCVSATDPIAVRTAFESIGNRDVLIQEFVPEIKTFGETSLLFFNGQYSHAVRKFAAANEFRIHAEYGGTRAPHDASAALIAQAKAVVDSVGQPLLFARVDLIERESKKAALVELEIVDPMLYLGYSPTAPEAFAEALASRL